MGASRRAGGGSRSTLLADSWYADALRARPGGAELVTTLEEALSTRPLLRWCAARSGVARGSALVLLGWRHAAVLTTSPAPGARTTIALLGLLRPHRLVLLEYIQELPPSGRAVRAVAARARFHVLRRLLLTRALLVAQVLTESERATYPAALGLPASALALVRWPARTTRDEVAAPAPTPSPRGRSVLASGRRTDWATVLTAARGADWDLTVVCTAEDLPTVRALAGSTLPVLHSEISQRAHQALVTAADVYVVAVPETGGSIGHVRIMNATDAGTALVVSDVVGVQGYVDERTAVLVPPGDADRLRAEVDALLASPQRRAALAAAAAAGGREWTMSDYLDALAEVVRVALARP